MKSKSFLVFIVLFLATVFLLTACGKETYTVTYLVDGDVLETQEIKEGSTISNPPTPEKAGYTFLGWEAEDFDISSPISGNMTFTASFAINNYNVKFYDGDTLLETKSISYMGLVTPVDAPSKTGYHLASWKNSQSDFDFNTPVTSDLILKTNYEINVYKVTFKSDSDVFVEKDIPHGQSVQQPDTNPTKKGHTFQTWKVGDQEFDFNQEIVAPITINASYTKNSYTVSFFADDVKLSEQTVLFGEKLSAVNVPEKEGQHLSYWKNGEQAFVLSSPVEDHMTLIAVYELNTYTVTFKDGTRSLSQSSVKHGSTVSIPSMIPTKTGYTFRTWQLNSVDYDFTAPVHENLIINADFTVNQYTVTFTVNGNKIGDIQVDYNTAASPIPAPEIEDASFRAWMLSGKDYDFSTPITKDIELVAEYVEKYEGTAINSVDQLKSLATAEPGIYTLIRDLKVLADWAPIPLAEGVIFEGHNHTISGLKSPLFSTVSGTVQNLVLDSPQISVTKIVKDVEDGNTGALAKALLDQATIHHVVINNANIGSFNVGGIAGYAMDKVTISDCSVSGSISITVSSSKGSVGGLIGYYKRTAGDKTLEYDGLTISNCTNDATITNDFSSSANAGGILGCTNNTNAYKLLPIRFENCINRGKITSSSDLTIAGGILGYNNRAGYCYFISCENHGEVSTTSFAGGILGSAYSGTSTNQIHFEADQCINTAKITSTGAGKAAGGILGNVSTINQPAYFISTINTGDVVGDIAGGLFGYSDTKHNVFATNSANTGNVTGKECAGSFIGKDNCTDGNASPARKITNCQFSGNITAPGKDAGLLVGLVNEGGGSIRFMSYSIIITYCDGKVTGANVGLFGHFTGMVQTANYGKASSSTVENYVVTGFADFKLYVSNTYLAGALTGTSKVGILFGLYENNKDLLLYSDEAFKTLVESIELSTSDLVVTGIESPSWMTKQTFTSVPGSYYKKNATEPTECDVFSPSESTEITLVSVTPEKPASSGLSETAQANEWKNWETKDGKPNLIFES